MGPGEAIAAVAFAGVAIGVLITVGTSFQRWVAYKQRKVELMADKTAENAAQYAAHVERLERRMRVLERIATDKGVDLAVQIEKLRDDPVLAQIADEELN